MKGQTFFRQIYFAYLITIFGCLFFVGILGVSIYRSFFYAQVEKSLTDVASMVKNWFYNEPDSSFESVDEVCKFLTRDIDVRLTVINSQGVVIGESDERIELLDNHMNRPEILSAFRGEKGTSLRYSNTKKEDFLYIAVPFYRGEEIVAVIRVSRPLDTLNGLIGSLAYRFLILGLLILFFSAVIVYIVTYRINLPLKTIRKAMEKYSKGELNFRFKIDNPLELRSLSFTVNSMAEQLMKRMDTITRQRNELKAILESMVEGVIVLNNRLEIEAINPAACTLFKIDPDYAIGEKILKIFRNSDLSSLSEKVLNNDGVFVENIELKEEKLTYLRVHGTSLKGGRERGILLVLHDITHMKQLENMRKEFVANVSHELKTPITTIKGFVETLRLGAIDDKDKRVRFLDIIEKSSNRLNSIIDDLLMLSTLDKDNHYAGNFTLTSIREVLENAITQCHKKADQKQIALGLKMEKDFEGRINKNLIEQAVINFIDNGIKYSNPQSQVEVSVDQGRDYYTISVSDHGVGIPPEHQGRIFERFYRVDKARSREMGGTGLGLSIVKHIAVVHRGEVALKSVPGEGSVFKIILPYERH